MLPHVTKEMHAATFVAHGPTAYTMSLIFPTVVVIMAVKGAQVVYAANNQPLHYVAL
jgi:hypothetical protein